MLAAALLLILAGATTAMWRRHEHAQAVRTYRHAEFLLARMSLPAELGARSANPVCTPAPDRVCSQTRLWPNQTVAPLLKFLGPGATVQRPGDCTDWNPNAGGPLTSLKKLPCTLHGHIGHQPAVAIAFPHLLPQHRPPVPAGAVHFNKRALDIYYFGSDVVILLAQRPAGA